MWISRVLFRFVASYRPPFPPGIPSILFHSIYLLSGPEGITERRGVWEQKNVQTIHLKHFLLGDDFEVIYVRDGGDGGGKVVPVPASSWNERVMIKIISTKPWSRRDEIKEGFVKSCSFKMGLWWKILWKNESREHLRRNDRSGKFIDFFIAVTLEWRE